MYAGKEGAEKRRRGVRLQNGFACSFDQGQSMRRCGFRGCLENRV